MELFELKEIEERVILVGVQENNGDDTEESLHELEELASTAGAVTVGMLIQNREAVHPGTYIGKGKIEELRILAEELGATGIICDDELSPVQLRNLEQELDIKVMPKLTKQFDIVHLCGKGKHQRGENTGGACPAQISSGKAGRTAGFPVQAWRRDRHQGAGREEAGDGQTFDQRPHRPVEP